VREFADYYAETEAEDVKFGVTDGHLGRLPVRNFTPIGAWRWERGPKR